MPETRKMGSNSGKYTLLGLVYTDPSHPYPLEDTKTRRLNYFLSLLAPEFQGKTTKKRSTLFQGLGNQSHQAPQD